MVRAIDSCPVPPTHTHTPSHKAQVQRAAPQPCPCRCLHKHIFSRACGALAGYISMSTASYIMYISHPCAGARTHTAEHTRLPTPHTGTQPAVLAQNSSSHAILKQRHRTTGRRLLCLCHSHPPWPGCPSPRCAHTCLAARPCTITSFLIIISDIS